MTHINEGIPYTPVNFYKYKGQPGEKLTPNHPSTRLQELSLKNISYDIHLDMKFYTISRIFQKISLSDIETLHQLCEMERTQILQSLALAVLKIT